MNLNRFILSTPRILKQITVLFVDIASLLFSLFFTIFILDIDYKLSFDLSILFLLLAILSFIPFSIYLGLYKSIFRFSSIYSIRQIFIVCNIYFIIFYAYIFFSNQQILGPSLAFVLFQTLVFFFFMSLTRTLIVIIYSLSINYNSRPSVLIYGAGKKGYNFYKSNQDKYNIICYLDDSSKLIGNKIDNIKILPFSKLEEMINKHKVDYLFISFKLDNKSLKENIFRQINPFNIGLRIISDLQERNTFPSRRINEVDISSIVRREINWDKEKILKLIENKNILVTGGGGSIGSELFRQLINYNPTKVFLLDNSEFNLYQINNEINKKNKKINFECILADLSDTDFIDDLFKKNKINIVFHAAAYKHVPLLEEYIFYAIKNNIFITLNLINIAIENNVENFTYISTDKAVRPTNIMGATKRFSEIIIQSFNEKFASDNIKFTIVRFGNVFASRGSAVPLFVSQVENGGPVTITDKLITRYFMSTSEAAGLVLESTHISEGGEVFVLNMGDPIKIYFLIKKIIQLSGFTEKTDEKPFGDIEVKSIGLRPGEKLYEELLIGNNPINTSNDNIFKANEDYIKYDDLIKKIENLENLLKKNEINQCIEFLKNHSLLKN
jgi:FlaA1/EpsC-like NDP-sugar epimerase